MPTQDTSQWKLTLVILSAASVLMALSYTMLIPFLPMYLIQELHVSGHDVKLWSGLIFSISFLISGIMAPVWGAIADKRSRKLMAVRAAFLLGVAYLLAGLVQNEWQLFAVRAFQGFASGLSPACLAIMAAWAPRDKLGFCLGTMQSAMTAGGVLGPLFGGLLAEWVGMRMTFFWGALGMGIITLLLIFFIKEPQQTRPARESTAAAKPKTQLLKNPVIRRMLLAAAVVQLSTMLVQPIMPLYVAQLKGDMQGIVLVTGLLFSIVGISGVIASPLWGIFGQKRGFRWALYTALFGAGVFGIVQAIPTSLTAFGTWRFIGGLMAAGIFPAINAVLTMSTEPAERGRMFGLSYSAQQVGSVLGPIVGGVVAVYCPLEWVIALSGLVLLPLAYYLYRARPAQETVKSTHGNEAKFD